MEEAIERISIKVFYEFQFLLFHALLLWEFAEKKREEKKQEDLVVTEMSRLRYASLDMTETLDCFVPREWQKR